MPSKLDFNAVLIIPTGIGCEIGGHAGDANPVAKLLASVCDTLILHPNVVNASDINEMPENCLYVEGSILDRFLNGLLYLQPVKTYNRIILAVNTPVRNETINAVSAAKVTIGADIRIVELSHNFRMVAFFDNGIATGKVTGWEELCNQVRGYFKYYHALAIASLVEVKKDVALDYLKSGGVNPWGGVEAMASKLIASNLKAVPVAHAPIETEDEEIKDFNKIVDPRMAAEVISQCYLHCVFKGLHKAPRVNFIEGISVRDVDCLITPVGCIGPPHEACLKANIPVIAVKENKTVLNDPMPAEFIIVENYWEAVGIMIAMKAGVHPASVRRL